MSSASLYLYIEEFIIKLHHLISFNLDLSEVLLVVDRSNLANILLVHTNRIMGLLNDVLHQVFLSINTSHRVGKFLNRLGELLAIFRVQSHGVSISSINISRR